MAVFRLHIAGAGVAVAVLWIAAAAGAETILLRSGNASPGAADPQIRLVAGAPATPLSTVPFTAVDFAAACAGPPATVLTPHPAWIVALPGDPVAQWVGVDANRASDSALHCQPFVVSEATVCAATLTGSFAADDALGDPGGPNPAGVYLNETPLAAGGGGYSFATSLPATDVAALLAPGPNRLHVYQRDLARAVAGALYSFRLDVTPCPTLGLRWGELAARRGTDGVRLTWETLDEDGTLAFEIQARNRQGGTEPVAVVPARGCCRQRYLRLDDSPAARAGGRLAYRLIELGPDGPGDVSPWLDVELAPAAGGGRRRPRPPSR